MANEQSMASIAASLALLARVAVLDLIAGKERDEQLSLLASLNFKQTEIAELLGMKANTVSKALGRLKNRAEAAE
jgi:CRP-like cAMP-binding protein